MPFFVSDKPPDLSENGIESYRSHRGIAPIEVLTRYDKKPGIFFFPNRSEFPSVVEFTGQGNWEELLQKHSLKLLRSQRAYYEGIDHNEVLNMLDDFFATNSHITPGKVIFINLDKHHDLHSDPGEVGIIHENWVKIMHDWGLYNDEDRRRQDIALGKGMVLLSRKLYYKDPQSVFRMEPEPKDYEDYWVYGGIYHNFGSIEYPNTGVPITHVALTTNPQEYIPKLIQAAKTFGYSIVTSIDVDLGNNKEAEMSDLHLDLMERDREALFDLDLQAQLWVQELVNVSAATMVFRSPGFAEQDYAKQQSEEFRKLFLTA